MIVFFMAGVVAFEYSADKSVLVTAPLNAAC